jgi:hypothetical protein
MVWKIVVIAGASQVCGAFRSTALDAPKVAKLSSNRNKDERAVMREIASVSQKKSHQKL